MGQNQKRRVRFVFVDDVAFSHMERMGQNQRRRVCFVQFVRWRHRGRSLLSPTAYQLLFASLLFWSYFKLDRVLKENPFGDQRSGVCAGQTLFLTPKSRHRRKLKALSRIRETHPRRHSLLIRQVIHWQLYKTTPLLLEYLQQFRPFPYEKKFPNLMKMYLKLLKEIPLWEKSELTDAYKNFQYSITLLFGGIIVTILRRNSWTIRCAAFRPTQASSPKRYSDFPHTPKIKLKQNKKR